MESGRFLFDPPAGQGNMLYLGRGNSDLRGATTMMSMSMQDGLKAQPFFRSPHDLFDEDYYDELYPEKKRRLTNDQVLMLEKSFEEENKLEPERKTKLAKKLGLQPRQVAVWFQNRRARWKTKQLERDYDLLKASYDSLLSNYDSIIKENALLKSEVASLTEKFQVKELDGAPMPGLTSEPLPIDVVYVGRKVEDHLSSGTGSDASAVVDEDCPQLIDSGDSYFLGNEYLHRVPLITEPQFENDKNNNGNNFLSDVFAVSDRMQYEGELSAWWVWP